MRAIRTCVAAVAASVVLAGPSTAAATPAHDAHTTNRTASPAMALGNFADGSFEYPTVPPNSFQDYIAGQFIGPWQVLSGSEDLIGAGYWQAAQGVQSLALNGFGTGAVAQTFATAPGTKYTVTYSLAGHVGGPPTVKTGKVLVDGQDYQDFSFNVTGKTVTNMGYVTQGFTFVATTPSTTLEFANTTPTGGYGPVIDNVVVEPLQLCPCA